MGEPCQRASTGKLIGLPGKVHLAFLPLLGGEEHRVLPLLRLLLRVRDRRVEDEHRAPGLVLDGLDLVGDRPELFAVPGVLLLMQAGLVDWFVRRQKCSGCNTIPW